jgi:uncharacterized protein YdhG (YjbR/CyaY superfamily)
MSTTQKPAKSKFETAKASKVFDAEERAAMQERAREVKAEARRGKGSKADGQADLLDKIAELPKPDREMAERIHAVVLEAAPDLAPRTWYGMPAYARNGKVVCFFTPAAKFKERYATFGFNAEAHLDEGSMWATSWALTKLTPADEKEIARLVKKAVS